MEIYNVVNLYPSGAYPAAFMLNILKHTNFFLSDGFQRSYGHVNKDPFFWDTL